MRTFIAIVVLLLATSLGFACSDESSQRETDIRASLREFTAAINSENYDAAYAKFSNWCRQSIPSDKFTENWESTMESGAAQLEFIDVEILPRKDDLPQTDDMLKVKTTFQLTKVEGTVEFGQEKESDPLIEWMVKEDGEWHIHDKVCELLGPKPGAAPSPTP